MNKKIKIFKLDKINSQEGSIIKFINKKSDFFKNFGELYFSTVKYNVEKKGRYHNKMHLNIMFIKGIFKFYFYDEKNNSVEKKNRIICRESSPTCISISPKIWFKFKGISKKENMLINFSNILHDPLEYKFSDEINDLWK